LGFVTHEVLLRAAAGEGYGCWKRKRQYGQPRSWPMAWKQFILALPQPHPRGVSQPVQVSWHLPDLAGAGVLPAAAAPHSACLCWGHQPAAIS